MSTYTTEALEIINAIKYLKPKRPIILDYPEINIGKVNHS